jgi:hypothetical protein
MSAAQYNYLTPEKPRDRARPSTLSGSDRPSWSQPLGAQSLSQSAGPVTVTGTGMGSDYMRFGDTRANSRSNSTHRERPPLGAKGGGVSRAAAVTSLNSNSFDDNMMMQDNAYAQKLKMLRAHSKDVNKDVNTDVNTKSAEYSTTNYTPRQRNTFSQSRDSLGAYHTRVPISWNAEAVVACYNRQGERNSGTKDVIKELIDKEERNKEEEDVKNGKKVRKNFFGRLSDTFSFIFDSLGLLLFVSPVFTVSALTSFFFFILLEPFFFLLVIVLLLFFHFFF